MQDHASKVAYGSTLHVTVTLLLQTSCRCTSQIAENKLLILIISLFCLFCRIGWNQAMSEFIVHLVHNGVWALCTTNILLCTAKFCAWSHASLISFCRLMRPLLVPPPPPPCPTNNNIYNYMAYTQIHPSLPPPGPLLGASSMGSKDIRPYFEVGELKKPCFRSELGGY